ncbi:hypothetical protein CH35J_000318 [Colletotrichum higginsianum]|uniref:Uncharacterized protein n=1 Tax=Colletotrichum higginsianum TaxID=80884 RepID=A0A4T0WIH3_9PEZI|nr:hypothetical protein CH35J_000318 [Colletotrichum higginsianum]
MEIPQPVLKAVAVALSIGILVELVVLANISSWYRENRMGWKPDTGRPVANDDDDDDDDVVSFVSFAQPFRLPSGQRSDAPYVLPWDATPATSLVFKKAHANTSELLGRLKFLSR